MLFCRNKKKYQYILADDDGLVFYLPFNMI